MMKLYWNFVAFVLDSAMKNVQGWYHHNLWVMNNWQRSVMMYVPLEPRIILRCVPKQKEMKVTCHS